MTIITNQISNNLFDAQINTSGDIINFPVFTTGTQIAVQILPGKFATQNAAGMRFDLDIPAGAQINDFDITFVNQASNGLAGRNFRMAVMLADGLWNVGGFSLANYPAFKDVPSPYEDFDATVDLSTAQNGFVSTVPFTPTTLTPGETFQVGTSSGSDLVVNSGLRTALQSYIEQNEANRVAGLMPVYVWIQFQNSGTPTSVLYGFVSSNSGDGSSAPTIRVDFETPNPFDESRELKRPIEVGSIARPDTVGTLTRPQTVGTLRRPATVGTLTRPAESGTITRPTEAGTLKTE